MLLVCIDRTMTERITDEMIDKWIADAKKSAQKFQWDADGHDVVCDLADDYCKNCVADCDTEINAIHIANACPQNFVAVLEELKKYKQMSLRNSWK